MNHRETLAPLENPYKKQMTARLLLQFISPVPPDMQTLSILNAFMANPHCIALPIVNGTQPVGLISRKTLIELFAKPFTHELSGKKPISAFMEPSPFIVEADTDLDDLSRRIVEAGMQHMYDGFIITQQGAYVGMGTGHDLMQIMTERKQAHLYHLAHYDALTGLPNRLLFEDRLTQALVQERRAGQLVALLFLDLDRFKVINDTFGHAVGDLLLKAVAERLSQTVRESDTVARMGGDEFTLIFSGLREPQDAGQIAQLILEAMAKPFVLEGHEVHVSASIGITLYPLDNHSIDGKMSAIETLLKNADTAMYKAKDQGKNNYQFFKAEMNVATLERLLLENDLRKALENGEFILHYQPRIHCADGSVSGMEALIRWRHPTLGLVSPAAFIPLAEETGLIVPIGEWVLRTACAQTKAWLDAGMRPLRVAVNLSARQFKHAGLIVMIENVLRKTGLNPSCLEVELTEGLAMEDVKQTVITLNTLNAIGVSIAIDDFGTGYSSLAYLKRFPVDFLKIDQSFVRDIGASADSAAIVKTIIAMAHNLQLEVVGEGVETAEQLEFLRQHVCEEVQGYLFSRPLPADEFVIFLNTSRHSIHPKNDAIKVPNRTARARAGVAGIDAGGTVLRTASPQRSRHHFKRNPILFGQPAVVHPEK